MKRFRVKHAGKRWTDKGPDLLRPRKNAVRRLKAMMGHDTDQWRYRVMWKTGFGEWSMPLEKSEIVQAFMRWSAPDGRVFQVGTGDPVEPKFVVKAEAVEIIPRNVNPAGEIVSALIHHQFPEIIFAGGCNCRRISGSTKWSDHAWCDAIDETENPPAVKNDDVTDWCDRMARAGCMDYDYLLGSRDNKVVISSAPEFGLQPSGASKSHLWHVHISIVDHGGADPGCA